MKSLRQANGLHAQYAAAMQHLECIVNLSSSVALTRSAVVDGKFLLAHKQFVSLVGRVLQHYGAGACSRRIDAGGSQEEI